MNGVFVGLIFNFCAGMTPTGDLQIGYQSKGECIVKIETNEDIPPDHGAVVNSHTLSWHQLEGGAEVQVDDQVFVIMHFREA